MRKVALLEEKERERPAGGLTLLRTSYVVGPPAINARRGGQVRKAQDDGRTNEECEGGGEKSERDERKVVIERANFSTCGQWRERESSEEDETRSIHGGVLTINCISEAR